MTRRFDAFLSHSSADALWVQRLAADLARYEVSVWHDETPSQPGGQPAGQPHGEPPDALEHALDTCGAMLLVVSPESLASGWVEETHARALALAQRKDAALHLIPVLLGTAELPPFLEQRTPVEFRDPDRYAESVWHVAWGILGEKPAHVLAPETPLAPAGSAGAARPSSSASPKPRAAEEAPGQGAITQQ